MSCRRGRELGGVTQRAASRVPRARLGSRGEWPVAAVRTEEFRISMGELVALSEHPTDGSWHVGAGYLYLVPLSFFVWTRECRAVCVVGTRSSAGKRGGRRREAPLAEEARLDVSGSERHSGGRVTSERLAGLKPSAFCSGSLVDGEAGRLLAIGRRWGMKSAPLGRGETWKAAE